MHENYWKLHIKNCDCINSISVKSLSLCIESISSEMYTLATMQQNKETTNT